VNSGESDEDRDDHDASENHGINLAGGPVTNTGAIVTGSGNEVTVRRSGITAPIRDGGRGHPLVNTGALVSGSRHKVEIEDSGDGAGAAAGRAEPGTGVPDGPSPPLCDDLPD